MDVVIIPFRQFFVSAAGAVKIPGRYPYVPDRSWEYYVNLAGGIDEERNAFGARTIVDVHGQRKPRDAIIEPEDSVIMADNSVLYTFGKVSGLLATIVSTATLIIAILRMQGLLGRRRSTELAPPAWPARRL